MGDDGWVDSEDDSTDKSTQPHRGCVNVFGGQHVDGANVIARLPAAEFGRPHRKQVRLSMGVLRLPSLG